MTETRQTFVLPAQNRGQWIETFLRRLESLPGRRYSVTIEPSRAIRSVDQNRLLWSLYTDILAIAEGKLDGWRKEDLHCYLLGEWSGWQAVEGFGHRQQRPVKRSSKLSKQEFSDYIEFICQRMSEHGIILTLPGEFDAAGY